MAWADVDLAAYEAEQALLAPNKEIMLLKRSVQHPDSGTDRDRQVQCRAGLLQHLKDSMDGLLWWRRGHAFACSYEQRKQRTNVTCVEQTAACARRNVMLVHEVECG
jgi:hypothetical protein